MDYFQRILYCIAITATFVSADIESDNITLTTRSPLELIEIIALGKDSTFKTTTLSSKSLIDELIEAKNLSAMQFCPPDEIWSKCGNCEKTCSIRELDPECLCVPGCICRVGFIRNFHGSCVRDYMCDSPCNGDFGQIFAPNGSCVRTCENINDPNWKCDLLGRIRQVCKCVDGLVKNRGGHCVRPEDCNNTCGYNEVYSECMANDCQDTCMEPKKRFYCPNPFCNSGCVCLENYLRDDNGVCIPKHSCTEFCNGDPNARKIKCTPAIRRTCANLNDWEILNPVCDGEESCICKDGYAEFDGICLPRSFCPECGPNELYLCRAGDLVASNVIDRRYIQKTPCTEGCYCKLGYARNRRGYCIKLSNHKQSSCNGDPNAYFDQCNLNCEKTCENKNGPKSCDTEKCTLNGKCLCKKGYVKNSLGKCIIPEMCDYKSRSFLPEVRPSNYRTCGPNEEYNKKTYAPQENTCEMFLSGQTSYAGEVCNPGCRCMPGFLRNTKGSCVSVQNCCDDANSELVSVPNTCPGGTCKHPDFEICDDKPWMPFGCQCKSGFLKISDTNSTCIPEIECCNYV